MNEIFKKAKTTLQSQRQGYQAQISFSKDFIEMCLQFTSFSLHIHVFCSFRV
ncbi:hypothetical protein DEO72_LG6g1072 [Vigna unguiculata]|uniref:Uncharacterized protein n=1 Tax=Vigna unguiculata TaxID=3917 RepID=A0A4D6M6R3_VIGUN|nr:hypothetical protein DEO72_LG6g1072 [Vigna unguiculata]